MKYLPRLLYSYLSGAASNALKELPKCRTMMRPGDSRKKGHMVGFLVGVSMGVGIALLLAPKSGANTRSTIAKKARESSEYLKQQASELSGTAADFIGKGVKETARAGRQSSETAV